MSTLTSAHTQYLNRPKDESFASLPDLITVAKLQRERSKETTYSMRDLRIVATGDGVGLQSPRGVASFTNWSFGQTCRMIKAPVAYVRTLPPSVIADAMNFGIADTPDGTTANILAHLPIGSDVPQVRSVNSETYARVWDDVLYSEAQRRVFDYTSQGNEWIAPPTWSGDSAGTWRGDRDSFVIRVDGGSIVTDPSAAAHGKDGRMYRGIILRNSEVGGGSIVIDWVLFQYICGNLMLWGTTVDRRFRRRHVGANVVRDTMRELGVLARQWTTRSAAQDEAIIQGLMDRELAHSREAVISELRVIGYTMEQANAAYDTCSHNFDASPRSYWGLAQGTTANSQTAEHQSARFELDMLAAAVMARGAKVLA